MTGRRDPTTRVCEPIEEGSGQCRSDRSGHRPLVSQPEPPRDSPRDDPDEDAVLRRLPLLAGLDEAHLRAVRAAARRRHVPAGDEVFAEGADPDGLYVVVRGTVRIFRRDDAGAEIQLSQRGEGEFFGELAILESAPRSASVAAVTDCELLALDQSTFLALMTGSDSRVAGIVLATLSRMVRERTDSLWREELARREIDSRTEIERHRALSQMVAGVAHELNTPLGISNTAADMIENRLRDGHLRELAAGDHKAEQAIDDIAEASALVRRNLARAHHLVQNFKRISVQQLSEAREAVDLSRLTRDVVDLYGIEARKARIVVVIDDRLPDADRRWVGYPGYYTQILLNLLTNVERYAYPAGAGGSVSIVLERTPVGQQPGFAVAVIDHGRGIEADHLPRIFEPFFTTGRIHGGTGLGMAIVHNIVTAALGGSIRVESTVGEGLNVRFEFPESAPPPPGEAGAASSSGLPTRGMSMS